MIKDRIVVALKAIVRVIYSVFRVLAYPLTLLPLSDTLPRHYVVSRFTVFFTFIVLSFLWNIRFIDTFDYLLTLALGILLAVAFALWGEGFEQEY